MRLTSVLLIVVWALVAWMFMKWFFESHVDDNISNAADNNVVIIMIIAMYLVLFYYFMLLTALGLISVAYLIKLLILDFFKVAFPDDVLTSIFTFLTSKRYWILNALICFAFMCYSIVSVLLSKSSSRESLRSKLNNLIIMFIVVYLVAVVLSSMH